MSRARWPSPLTCGLAEQGSPPLRGGSCGRPPRSGGLLGFAVLERMPMIVPRLRAPLVLVHGLLGFDQVRLGPWVLANYFRGVPELLSSAGNRLLVAHVSPTAGVADRAVQLRSFLDQAAPKEAVHLIAHSMGGLDCRYLTSRFGLAA